MEPADKADGLSERDLHKVLYTLQFPESGPALQAPESRATLQP